MLTLKTGFYLFMVGGIFLSSGFSSEEKDFESSTRTAVIVVDLQADFTLGGPLPVPNSGKDYIEGVDSATRKFKGQGFRIFATQDWHPKGHISFYTSHKGKNVLDEVPIQDKESPVSDASQQQFERLQTLWPPHCVQGTEGADILLPTQGLGKLIEVVVQKGMHADYNSYSGFQDDGGNETPLNEMLKQIGVEKVVIYGIATDYCVKATVIDALKRNYKTSLITSLSRGVKPESTQEAIQDMKKAGAALYETVEDFLADAG